MRPTKNGISRAIYFLVGLLLFTPAVLAQAQHTHPSSLDVDATVSAVRIAVDLTGQLQVRGADAARVRVEATPLEANERLDCPIVIEQNGDLVTVEVSASERCKDEVDLQVYVPRRFSATILAPKVREVVVHDLDGRVTGVVSPDLKCHFKSFRGSSSCAEGEFDVRFSGGTFAMRAQDLK